MTSEKVFRRAEVEAITGLARSTLYAQMHAGRFPLPVKLTSRAVGWMQSDLEDWLAKRPVAANLKPRP